MVLRWKKKRMLRSERIHRIIEMAFDKRQFQTRVLNLAKQIAENWCLCQYCHKYAKTFSTYVHWKSELEGYLDELNTMSIDNNISREKWSLEILRKGDFDDAQKVFRQCKRKFMIERVLNMPNNFQIEVCEDFSSMIEDIAKCIGSVDCIVQFTCKWFPEVFTTFDIQWKSEYQ